MKLAGRIAAVALLCAVPAGYLVVAARQSTGGTSVKEHVANATEPLHGRPYKTLRHIYGIPLPGPADTANGLYYETNSWKTSSLYLRFDTTTKVKDWFLWKMGTSQAKLTPGFIPITEQQQNTFGWKFSDRWRKSQTLAGTIIPPKDKGGPSHRVLINTTVPGHPAIYVVSTVTF